MDGWMDGRIDGEMNGRIDELMASWKDVWMDKK
jgi:hypothetical protein